MEKSKLVKANEKIAEYEENHAVTYFHCGNYRNCGYNDMYAL